MRKIFYDKINNKEVIDITGQKNLVQIKAEFGDFDFQEISIEENEIYKVDDNQILRTLTTEELQIITDNESQNKIASLQDRITKLSIEKDKATSLEFTDLANQKQIEIDILNAELITLLGV